MAPLFAFAVLASGKPLTAAMAREHYALVNALGEPGLATEIGDFP